MNSTIATLTTEQRDDFTTGFAIATLWANVASYESNDDGSFVLDSYGEPERNDDAAFMAESMQRADLETILDVYSPESQTTIRQTCDAFMDSNAHDLLKVESMGRSFGDSGHDFALTSAGHGTGFWDRGTGETGERLSNAARVYGAMGGDLDSEGIVTLY